MCQNKYNSKETLKFHKFFGQQNEEHYHLWSFDMTHFSKKLADDEYLNL